MTDRQCNALFDSAMLWGWLICHKDKGSYPLEDMENYDNYCHLCEVSDSDRCEDCPMLGEWPNLADSDVEGCSGKILQHNTPVDNAIFEDNILEYDRGFFAAVTQEAILKTWEECYD